MTAPLGRAVAFIGVVGVLSACAAPATSQTPAPQPQTQRAPTTAAKIDPAEAQRLQRIMLPLFRVMDHPRQPSQVKVGVVDDPQINAGSGGSGEFIVTRGLLAKANDDQLTAVLAHEIAHDDLNHVAKAQTLGAGLNIGMVILDQIFPGSGALAPIAGTLIARKYGRNEEYAADRHGAELLRRAGLSPELMVNTLTWLQQTEGTSGNGGFFSTHPATGDRIDALKRELRAMNR
jgi:Zn-dependent protease with chaperone function